MRAPQAIRYVKDGRLACGQTVLACLTTPSFRRPARSGRPLRSVSGSINQPQPRQTALRRARGAARARRSLRGTLLSTTMRACATSRACRRRSAAAGSRLAALVNEGREAP